MSNRASYHEGFAPRDGRPLYPSLWTGCVGAWAPCLGATGLRLLDWSPLKNHGILINMQAGDQYTWVRRDKVLGLGFYTIGTDYVSGTHGLPVGSSKFTISLWCLKGATGHSINYSVGGETIGSRAHALWYADGNVYCSVENGDFQYATYVPAFDDKYHHIALVFDGTQTTDATRMKLYFDGIQRTLTFVAGTVPSTGITSSTLLLSRTNNTDYGSGSIAEFMLHNRVLSPQEIRTMASRPAIAYELAPVRRAGESAAAYRRRLQAAQMIGGGML